MKRFEVKRPKIILKCFEVPVWIWNTYALPALSDIYLLIYLNTLYLTVHCSTWPHCTRQCSSLPDTKYLTMRCSTWLYYTWQCIALPDHTVTVPDYTISDSSTLLPDHIVPESFLINLTVYCSTWLHCIWHCTALPNIPRETYIPRKMLCGHCADIYLQGYMSALYPSSVLTSMFLIVNCSTWQPRHSWMWYSIHQAVLCLLVEDLLL